MITKVLAGALVGASVAAAAAVGVAAPAGADPSAFGVLSCGCHETAPADSALFTNNVQQGIQQGLSDPGVGH